MSVEEDSLLVLLLCELVELLDVVHITMNDIPFIRLVIVRFKLWDKRKKQFWPAAFREVS